MQIFSFLPHQPLYVFTCMSVCTYAPYIAYIHCIYSLTITYSHTLEGFIQRGQGALRSSPPPQNLEFVIALKYEKMTVILHTSGGNLGAVSYM